MDVFQNMELFSELIQCGGNIYTWCYNADGSLLQSNCPEAGFLSGAFEIFGCKKKKCWTTAAGTQRRSRSARPLA